MAQVALFAASAAMTIAGTYLQAKAANKKAGEVNAVADQMKALNDKRREFERMDKEQSLGKQNRIRLGAIRNTLQGRGFDTESSRTQQVTQGLNSELEGKIDTLNKSAEFSSEQNRLSTEYTKKSNSPVDTSYVGLATSLVGNLALTSAKDGGTIFDPMKPYSDD
jgi:hypothetical protein|tara:strand:+ start:4397 stop:4891 length:495 start_codon:yes stop_codon:yes gene_type:complete